MNHMTQRVWSGPKAERLALHALLTVAVALFVWVAVAMT